MNAKISARRALKPGQLWLFRAHTKSCISLVLSADYVSNETECYDVWCHDDVAMFQDETISGMLYEPGHFKLLEDVESDRGEE